MTPFTFFSGRVAVLDRANVDTDQIVPARFLRKPRSAGYGNFLFHDLRAGDSEFPVRKGDGILLTGENFGCGSSREGAVYALVDDGVRCVIAPSFGDIFAGNAAKNGLLTIVLPADRIAELAERFAGRAMEVDLPAQEIRAPRSSNFGGGPESFEVDPFVKRCLIGGLDAIGLTLEFEPALAAFEQGERSRRPWVSPGR